MTRTAGTALVVDDDSDLRSLYRHWLGASDEVVTAADGTEALDRVDERVDAVLLDREMPRTDGVTVARELAERELDPAVVMVTGVEPGVELLDVPVEDYLQKPVDRETLLDRVGRALAVADQPRPRRHLLSLDTRRRVVAASAGGSTTEPAYREAVETLDRHSETLRAARHAVAVERRRDEGPAPESSVRESR